MLLLYKYIDFNIWFPYINVFMGFWLARGVARFVVDSYIIYQYCLILARRLVVCIVVCYTVVHYCSSIAFGVVHVVLDSYIVYHYCVILARIIVVCVAAVHTVEHYCSIVALRVVHVVVVTYVVDYCFLTFNSTS